MPARLATDKETNIIIIRAAQSFHVKENFNQKASETYLTLKTLTAGAADVAAFGLGSHCQAGQEDGGL